MGAAGECAELIEGISGILVDGARGGRGSGF